MFQAASVFGGNGASTVLWRWLYRVDSGAYDDGLAPAKTMDTQARKQTVLQTEQRAWRRTASQEERNMGENRAALSPRDDADIGGWTWVAM